MKILVCNIIVPPIYLEIYGKTQPFLTVRAGNSDDYEGFASSDGEVSVTSGQKNKYMEGLITPDGKMVLPARFERIGWCRDSKHFFTCSNELCEMYVVEEK